MPYHDLSLAHTSDTRAVNHAVAFAAELGYTTLALSTTITGKLPSTPPSLDLRTLQDAHPTLTLLSRLTLPISDPSQNHRLSQFSSAFSLLALRPLNEKALQLACTSLDCDIISLDLSLRLPCLLKFKTLSAALQRGVRFEITYSPALLSGSDAKRNLIAGATSLIRATRGRGIIISSEAKSALGLRGPHDVMNLCQIWGLEQARGKEAVCEEAGKVVRLAALRRQSYRGVITVVDGAGLRPAQEDKAAKLPAQASAAAASNGVKRKASTSSLTHNQSQPPAATSATATTDESAATPSADTSTLGEENDKLLSKREQKRRAKKARLEGYVSQDDAGLVNGSRSHVEGQLKSTVAASKTRDGKYAIRHESLAATGNSRQKQGGRGGPQDQRKKPKKGT